MQRCKINSCFTKVHSREWCKPHYDAWRRKGNPTTYKGDRSHLTAWEKIQEIGWTKTVSGCYEYNGYRNKAGYGQFRSSNKLIRVHRMVYKNLVGDLSDEEVVMHLCDNPSCGEPTHLKRGTQSQNIQDMFFKNRHARANMLECKNGHIYPPNRPKNIAKNRCRVCANENSRLCYARKRQYGVAN